ncbi:hypothetical protein BC830DRAFT_1227221 [Chytriomyces sp. MP71]|nr:hypothetical protein BC830DRAFT_1227221 [Chytriomyces sp. MP71]
MILARLFSLATVASLAFPNGYGGIGGIGVPVVDGSFSDWVIVSSYLADYQVEEASIFDASVFVSGTWVPVHGGPDQHTNNVTIGNTIAWLPGSIIKYNDLFFPFQNGVTANMVALPASAAISLPQFIKVEDGIFTFQTKNWDQIIAFQCVNGTGDIDYGGFLETCESQINVPSTCYSFVANVAPVPLTPSKVGAASVPY